MMSSYEQISVLPFPRELVWHALTQGKLLRGWLPARESELSEGATFALSGLGAGEGRVQSLVSPRELVVELNWGSTETVFKLRLSEIVHGTRVTIVHRGFHGARAWMIARRQEARVKKLIEKDLRPTLDGMLHDQELAVRLERARIDREAAEEVRLAKERADRDQAEAERRREAEERREAVRQAAEARRIEERERVERALLENEAQPDPDSVREARARAESDALAEKRDREEAERQQRLRAERREAARLAEVERERERVEAEELDRVRQVEARVDEAAPQADAERVADEAGDDDHAAAGEALPEREIQPAASARSADEVERETAGARQKASKKKAQERKKEQRRRRREEAAARRDEERKRAAIEQSRQRAVEDRPAEESNEPVTVAEPRESEEAMRKRLFGELTGLLEAARGEALAAFRGRFQDTGIPFDELVQATKEGGDAAAPLGREEAVAEFERRQEAERDRAFSLQDERDAERRGSAGAETEQLSQLESHMELERRMLEELLRERQAQERDRFERALDARLAEYRLAQERAREIAEIERRRTEEERRAIEDERRSVEAERRRLAEDRARQRAEEVARQSAREEIERVRRSETLQPRPAPVAKSPRERAAEERMRAIREQRAQERRRKQEAELAAQADPKEEERQRRLRAAIAEADRSSGNEAGAATAAEAAVQSDEPAASTEEPSGATGLGRRISGLFGRRREETSHQYDGNEPRPDRDGRILTLHPGDEPGSTIEAAKYHTMRAAILEALPYDDVGVELKDLPDLVRPHLPDTAYPRHVSITWYCVRVKLDLEARGLLEVVPDSRPQRVRRLVSDEVRREA